MLFSSDLNHFLLILLRLGVKKKIIDLEIGLKWNL